MIRLLREQLFGLVFAAINRDRGIAGAEEKTIDNRTFAGGSARRRCFFLKSGDCPPLCH